MDTNLARAKLYGQAIANCYWLADAKQSSGMNTDELRRKKLCALIDEYEGNQAAFATKIDESASFLSQMKKGHRPIPDDVARKCEQAMKKPDFWMDTPLESSASPELEEVLRRFERASEERKQIILDLLRRDSNQET